MMDQLKESFEGVADWCEKHLEEQPGPEIGMTFRAMIRAYGRLARTPNRLEGERRAAAKWDLNAKAEELLLKLSRRIVAASYQVENLSKPVEPTSIRTNMTYDSGPRPKE